ncbi:hypothetical protein SRHO_G00036110 [Serrasalmus rhombeus]
MSYVRWDLAQQVLRSKAAGGPSSPAEPALPEVNQISWGKEGSPGPAQGPALFTLHSSMLIGRFGEDMTFRQCRIEATGHPSELVSRHSLFGRFGEEGGKKAEERCGWISVPTAALQREGSTAPKQSGRSQASKSSPHTPLHSSSVIRGGTGHVEFEASN